MLAEPKACKLDKCMTLLVDGPSDVLKQTVRSMPQTLAVIIVGNYMVGCSSGQATSSVEEGWRLFKALEHQMLDEPAIGHKDEFVDMRTQIKEILTLADDGPVKDRILLLLAHVVCIHFLKYFI
jgi:hypothetical protein